MHPTNCCSLEGRATYSVQTSREMCCGYGRLVPPAASQTPDGRYTRSIEETDINCLSGVMAFKKAPVNFDLCHLEEDDLS